MSDSFHVRYLFVVIASSKSDSFMFIINMRSLDLTEIVFDMIKLTPKTPCSMFIKTLFRLLLI
jgi:hypothetical protein